MSTNMIRWTARCVIRRFMNICLRKTALSTEHENEKAEGRRIGRED
jgi:hypothetical protein